MDGPGQGGARPRVRLPFEGGAVRSYEPGDAVSLARHGNDRGIWQNLRDGFPHPYRVEDGEAFVAMALARVPESFFAIDVGGEAVGGIGFSPHEDVERLSAEVGYWLGRAFWGRGVVTAALRVLTVHAIEAHGLVRLYAAPYATNPASARVLEKAGYVFEGRLRLSAIKEGRLLDQLLYAYVSEPPVPVR